MIFIKNVSAKIMARIVYAYSFGSFGKKVILRKPLEINNPQNIAVGDRSFIGEYAWLMVTKTYPKGYYALNIGHDCQIGHFAHIVAQKSVVIGNSVLIADRVFISDCTHKYEDIEAPVLSQKVDVLNSVTIGEGSWIGENVCICGASVGKHCVIGANSVVTRDIPDYCVAVGSPAKIVKKYDTLTRKWTAV